MDRDFLALGELLGAQIRSARPMDREFLVLSTLLGADNRLAGPIDREFRIPGAALALSAPPWELLVTRRGQWIVISGLLGGSWELIIHVVLHYCSQAKRVRLHPQSRVWPPATA